MNEFPGNYGWKKSQYQKVIYFCMHESVYITLLKWQIYRNEEQIGGCQMLRSGVRVRGGCGYTGIAPGMLCSLQWLWQWRCKRAHVMQLQLNTRVHTHTHTTHAGAQENSWNLSQMDGLYQRHFLGCDISFSFARFYHQRKWIKCTQGLCITSCSCMRIYSYLKII